MPRVLQVALSRWEADPSALPGEGALGNPTTTAGPPPSPAEPTHDAEGWSPLHVAAFAGRAEEVRGWLDAGAEVDRRSRHGCRGATSLLCAAAAGSAEVAELLMRRGASVEARDESGYTPLLLASELGHLEVLRTLLRHGADPRAELGDTGALALARRGRHARVVALLRQQGAVR